MIRDYLLAVRQAILHFILARRLDTLAKRVTPEPPVDPVLLFAGTPPAYPDYVPDDYGVYEELGSVGPYKIVCYRPRGWYYDDGAFVLEEGLDVGDDESEFREFTLRITPDEYVAHRVVHAAADWSTVPLQSDVKQNSQSVDL